MVPWLSKWPIVAAELKVLMNKPTDLPISDDDWQQTPVSVQVLVITLWERVKRVDWLEQRVEELERQLRHRGGPPSSDPPRPGRRANPSAGLRAASKAVNPDTKGTDDRCCRWIRSTRSSRSSPFLAGNVVTPSPATTPIR